MVKVRVEGFRTTMANAARGDLKKISYTQEYAYICKDSTHHCLNAALHVLEEPLSLLV